MNVQIDGLVMALASIIEDASTLKCTMVNHKSLCGSSESEELSVVIDMFRHLLEMGRTVDDVEVIGYQTPVNDWVEFVPQKGTVQILFRTDSRTYTITIRQQSVHAQGGVPYGHQ